MIPEPLGMSLITRATVYRSPGRPQMPWSLGVGFDDHLAVLRPGEDAPLDAADVALAAAGLHRVEEWRPHHPRASWGWRTAIVTCSQPDDGRLHLAEAATGTQDYAILLSDEVVDTSAATRAYLRRWETGQPEPLAFAERRAARDPSVDHSSHSAQWVGGCGECPSDTDGTPDPRPASMLRRSGTSAGTVVAPGYGDAPACDCGHEFSTDPGAWHLDTCAFYRWHQSARETEAPPSSRRSPGTLPERRNPSG